MQKFQMVVNGISVSVNGTDTEKLWAVISSSEVAFTSDFYFWQGENELSVYGKFFLCMVDMARHVQIPMCDRDLLDMARFCHDCIYLTRD